uniref:Putative structural protein n=1 Tax=viral metagenome TaxID=1070528 RepID=A0A6H1ZJA2_9ZZZZ
MREITEHQVNECNEKIKVLVMDEPGAGGACHKYLAVLDIGHQVPIETEINFQNGPIAEVGTNGITQEVLVAICVDRLRSFQTGPYACRENALALTKLEEAQHWLHHRTRQRLARGVEGTHEK